ncbi:hypothetical protein PV04_02742 [Phialophora macrospora]|uniref:Phospholipase/carboxylesterase/thioesterase domain-containing protein n=1 Tax=Phialophora macrospora TaxID=1851006 RepID=A0A0D2FVF8_9EURO|nr:hypothetical protein PV04_02742 [Phialophora macrospora]
MDGSEAILETIDYITALFIDDTGIPKSTWSRLVWKFKHGREHVSRPEAHLSHRPETAIVGIHGAEDPKIKCSLGKEAADTLQMLGMDVTWRCYPELGHWYKIPEEIDDIAEYLTGKLTI